MNHHAATIKQVKRFMKLQFRSFTHAALLSAFITAGAISAATAASDSPEVVAEKQRTLLEVLKSDAPPAEKAITCKRLAIYGSKEAVPALAALLPNKELSSWARIALEAIPGPEAEAALREAMEKVSGRLLVGVINSVGFRRDAQAVGGLVQRLDAADPDVAAAAAAALGRIGGDVASKALEAHLATAPDAVRVEVAEGCVRCAEKYLAADQHAEAIRLYDAVRQSKAPPAKQLEAVRGAILARETAGISLLMEQLQSPEKSRFGIGLRVARELPGQAVTEALAAGIASASPERQPAIIATLADRQDSAVLPALSKILKSDPNSRARLAAISALERLNAPGSLAVLVEAATSDSPELVRPAKVALTRLSYHGVDAEVVTSLGKAQGKSLAVLIELAGQRRIDDAFPVIARLMESPDAGIRSAAVGGIGIMGTAKEAGDLVTLLQKTANPKEREGIKKALLTIAGRVEAAAATPVLPLMQSSDSALRIIGVHVLAGAGGAAALTAVTQATEDKDETVQDEAVRALSNWANNWPEDEGVAAPLLALAKSNGKASRQVLGLRGYLQFIQGDKKLKADDKIAKLKEIQPLLNRPEEKHLAISVLSGVKTGSALEMLRAFAADAAVAEEACLTLADLAAQNDLQDASKELRQQSLQTVIEKSKDAKTQEKAQAALKKLQ